MKIRNGFVSNSSSSSFIIIDAKKGHQTIFPEYIKEGVFIVGDLGETEFGWGPMRMRDMFSRINFAYLQAIKPEWMKILHQVIKEHIGCQEIKSVLTDQYPAPDGYYWGYIDHQSDAYEGQNIEIFDSPEILKDFLFGFGSEIVLDHDNH